MESAPFSNLIGPPRAVPRLVRCRLLFGGFPSQFGWFFLGFGMIFVWVFVPATDVSSLIHFNGPLETTTGLVTRSDETMFTEGGSEHSRGTPIYANHYAFESGGIEYEGISFATGRRLDVENSVTIEYLAESPERSRIRGMRTRPYAAWSLFVLILPAVGFGSLVSGLRRGVRAVRLLTRGRTGHGRLKSKKPTNATVNDKRVYRLVFEFKAEDGSAHEVVVKTHDTRRLEDEHEEPLLYDVLDPTYAVMLDQLPGAPRVDETGKIRLGKPAGTVISMIIPAATIVGHGTYLWLRFFS